jgi:hypothetical protein
LEELGVSLGFHESSGTGKHQIGERLEPNLMLRRVYAQPTRFVDRIIDGLIGETGILFLSAI